MPRPLCSDLRARVMQLLEHNVSITEISRRLSVSRQTIYRYRRAAQEQERKVPQAKPMGGYRHSKVRRDQITGLAQLAVEHPKATLQELQALAQAPGGALQGIAVSDSTVARALHKSGLKKRRARYRDPKTTQDPGLVAERARFQHAQRHDPVISDPTQLLFFDETYFRLNEQATRAWGTSDSSAPPVLLKPKGKAMTTGLFLTLGTGGLLHYSIKPPRRVRQALGSVFVASELCWPGRGVDVGLSAQQIRRGATVAQLQAALRRYGVRSTGLRRAELAARVRRLRDHGPLGLPRAGRQDVGGMLTPFRAATRDVVHYLADELSSYLESQGEAGDRTLIWDNAPTHSPVKTTDTNRLSLFHRLAPQWNLANVAFLPPRSPSLNPVELCFAFLKHWVRKWAPDTGYTQAGLEASIRRAVQRVKSTMILHWIQGCGYGRVRAPHPPPAARQQDLNRLVDVNGTIVSDERLGVDIRARRPKRSPTAPLAWPRLRYAGYGPPPAGNRTETRPPECNDLWVDHHLYEPERIVDQRFTTTGVVEYRVRWRGYDAAKDTWEAPNQFVVGGQRLLRDWRHRQQRMNRRRVTN